MGIVMMSVMEKDSQPKRSFGLQHPERWSPDAVDFLSKTEFFPVGELAQVSHSNRPHCRLFLIWQHKFVENRQRYKSLVQLVEFAKTAAFKLYNYEGSADLF